MSQKHYRKVKRDERIGSKEEASSDVNATFQTIIRLDLGQEKLDTSMAVE
jgi:hypothetical protein